LNCNRNYHMAVLLMAAAGLLELSGCASQSAYHDHHHAAASENSPIAIPEPIKIEHDHLHAQLKQATQAGGETGRAAQQVQQTLSGHFEEENELVMPLLGLLEPLAKGEVTEAMRPAIAISKQVERKLPTFLAEHREIHEAVNALEAAAKDEGKAQVAAFARRLRLHAQNEEVVLYPAAIVIGQQVEHMLAIEQEGGR